MTSFLTLWLLILPTPADDITPKFEYVLPANDLVNRPVVSRDGQPLGKVADIVIDCRFNRITFVTIRRPDDNGGLSVTTMLPAVCLRLNKTSATMTAEVSAERAEAWTSQNDVYPATLTRVARLRDFYQHFDVPLYWTTAESSQRKSAWKTLPLMTLDELDGRIVRDSQWDRVARVNEVVVTPTDHWKVAYFALGSLRDHDSEQRIAVPMAAFRRQKLSPTWLLNVSADAELMKHTFEAGDWPDTIDRGWVEFTHVKYGSNTRGGVQSGKKKGDAPPASVQ